MTPTPEEWERMTEVQRLAALVATKHPAAVSQCEQIYQNFRVAQYRARQKQALAS